MQEIGPYFKPMLAIVCFMQQMMRYRQSESGIRDLTMNNADSVYVMDHDVR